MGRNTAIKQFSATPAGQPLELFDEAHERRPIVLELFASPWIMRAADLCAGEGASAVKHSSEILEVTWDAVRQHPSAFRRAERSYAVDTIVQSWAVEQSWWDPRTRVSRRFWRVLSAGGVYDIAYNREDGRWLLMGIQD